MPIHDWTRVDHGTFHDFHQGWAPQIRSALNNGLLPAEYEAKVEMHANRSASEYELDPYIRLCDSVVIRNKSERAVLAVELVSPGNKSTRRELRAFVQRVTAALACGIHVLVVDLFPPDLHDPSGIQYAIWESLVDKHFFPPTPSQPLTLVSYDAGPACHAYIQPVAVGEVLPDMPLFLEPGAYVSAPLEATYTAAFEGISRRTRDALNAPG